MKVLILKPLAFTIGEIHEDDKITSSQKHSHDELYVLDSKFHPLHSFRIPIHQQDEEWKKLIDEYIQKKLAHPLKTAQKQYNIRSNPIYHFSFNKIYQYEEHSLPGFNEKETKEINGHVYGKDYIKTIF